MSEFTVPCEGCGEQIPESDALIDRHSPHRGATIEAWCSDCQNEAGFL